MLTEEYIIVVYCIVEDILKNISEKPLRKRGPLPALTDAEVITMEIAGESMGIDKDTGIHSYFMSHWKHFFPKLGCRTTYSRQAANLWKLKVKIQEEIAKSLLPDSRELSIIDGFPMPICNFRRAKGLKIFRDTASYGYCAAKDVHYYGFRGHLLIDKSGVILGVTVVPANIDEREAMFDLLPLAAKDILGDKGYLCSPETKEDLSMIGKNLHTPLRKNMKEKRPKNLVSKLNNTRRLIETVIGQLSERFNMEKVRARDLWHLTVRTGRKILAHTVNCYINRMLGNPILQFEKILK